MNDYTGPRDDAKTDELFQQIWGHYGCPPAKSGNVYVDCPHCGKPATNKSCSFTKAGKNGAAGYYCFVCGEGGGLYKLASTIGILDVSHAPRYTTPAPAPKPAEPKPAPAWRANTVSLLNGYTAHTERFERWAAYKPLSRETIESMRLGVGVLPSSRCSHERLIVPIIRDGAPIWFRGRQLGCSCEGKWLVSGGFSLQDDKLPMYNIDAVAPGDTVWIVENPVDALMLSEQTGYTGIALYSVSYWRDEWAKTLAAKRPKWVIVAFDNDIPGNGGGAQHAKFAAEWREKHGGKLMASNGPKLVNRLLEAGLPARLFDWPENYPVKSDIGSMLMEMSGSHT